MLLGLGLGLNITRGRIAAAAPANPVAPTLVGVTTMVTGASGTTRAPDYSNLALRQYDVLIAQCVSRATGTNSTTPPAGEGWTLFWSFRAASFTVDFYWKRWGNGDTDPPTQISTFTFQTGGATLGAAISIWRGCKRTGNPFSQLNTVPGALTAATATPVSATVASAVGTGTRTLWFFATSDDNALNANSRGTLGYGGAGANVGATGSAALVHEADVDSSTVTCTVTESTNGNDSYLPTTVVLEGMVPEPDPLTVYPFSLNAVGRSRINDTGWRSGVVSDRIVRSGYHYRYAACVNQDRTVTLISQRKLVADTAWTTFATYTTAVISDPAGVTYWPADSHFTISLGVSKTGKLHMWLLAHAAESAMQHWVGTGPGDVTASSFSPDVPASGMSYPDGFQTADGTLCFTGRVGTAGNDAQQVLYEQTADESGWTLITNAIMNFTDGTGDDESPYRHRMILDPARDELHVAWVWAKQNVSSAQHGLMYVRGVRTGAATWVWEAADGTSVTLPVLDTTVKCQIETSNLPMQVHGGCGFNPSTGNPLIPYAIAATSSAGSGTLFKLATWNGSAFVKNDVATAHATYNLVGAPPASERNVVRTPEAFQIGSTIYFTWTGDQDLSSSGLPCLMKRTSTDGGATWSSASRLADLSFVGCTGRLDQTGLTTFGRLTYYQQLLDDNDGIFTIPVDTVASIVDVVP